MGIKVTTSGDFSNIETYLIKHRKSAFTQEEILEFAEYGLELFKRNTPTHSGKTAASWNYEIEDADGKAKITYHNTNIQNGYNIAILIDTGHATAQGSYVPGVHYIDSTIKDICKYIDKH